MFLEKNRDRIEKDFEDFSRELPGKAEEIKKRMEALSPDIVIGMKYLYSNMPYSDVGNYTFDTYLDYVQQSETKCKLRGNIAASDHMSELFYNIISGFSFDHIDIQVCICTCHFQGVHSGIPNIKGQFRRIIEKQSKCCLSAYNNKVMSTI